MTLSVILLSKESLTDEGITVNPGFIKAIGSKDDCFASEAEDVTACIHDGATRKPIRGPLTSPGWQSVGHTPAPLS